MCGRIARHCQCVAHTVAQATTLAAQSKVATAQHEPLARPVRDCHDIKPQDNSAARDGARAAGQRNRGHAPHDRRRPTVNRGQRGKQWRRRRRAGNSCQARLRCTIPHTELALGIGACNGSVAHLANACHGDCTAVTKSVKAGATKESTMPPPQGNTHCGTAGALHANAVHMGTVQGCGAARKRA